MNFLRNQQIHKTQDVKNVNKLEKYNLLTNTLSHFENDLHLFIKDFSNILSSDTYNTLLDIFTSFKSQLTLITSINPTLQTINNLDLVITFKEVINILDGIFGFINDNEINNKNNIKIEQNKLKQIEIDYIARKNEFITNEKEITSRLTKEEEIYNKEQDRIKVCHKEFINELKERLNILSEDYVLLSSELEELQNEKTNLDEEYKSYKELNKLIRNNIKQNIEKKNTLTKNLKAKNTNINKNLDLINISITEVEAYLNDYQLYKLNINKTYYNNINNLKYKLQALVSFLKGINDTNNNLELIPELFISRFNEWLNNNDYNNIFISLFNKEIGTISTLLELENYLAKIEHLDSNLDSNYDTYDTYDTKIIINNTEELNDIMNIIEKNNLDEFKGDYLEKKYLMLKRERNAYEVKLRKLRNRKLMLESSLSKNKKITTNLNGDFLKAKREDIILLNKRLKLVNLDILTKKDKIFSLKNEISSVSRLIEEDKYNLDLEEQNTRCETRLTKMKTRLLNQLEQYKDEYKLVLNNYNEDKANVIQEINILQNNEKQFNITFKSRLTNIINIIKNNTN